MCFDFFSLPLLLLRKGIGDRASISFTFNKGEKLKSSSKYSPPDVIFSRAIYIEWRSENIGAKVTTKFLHHEAIQLTPFLMGPRWWGGGKGGDFSAH